MAIAELSTASSEMNKLFLALSSVATQPTSETLSSDEEEASGRGNRGASRKGRFGGSGGKSKAFIDDLLGSRDARTSSFHEPSAESNASEEAFKKKNRLFAFMQKHRKADADSAKKLRFNLSESERPKKRRGNRATRYVH